MKVCQVIGSDLKKLAGLEKHFIEICNNLSKNVQLSIIAHKSYKKHLNENINFIEIDMTKSRFSLFNLYKIYKILKNNQFDIVHTQANKATWIISKIKPFIKITKFVATLHNSKKNTNAFNKFDYVIGVSNKVLNKININKKAIYNGVDENLMKNIAKIDLKKEFNIKNDFPVAVCVGRYVKAKGLDILIEAIKNIHINILLIGDGPLFKELENKVVATNQKEKIFLTGFREDAKELIYSSDLAIISSRNEGFSYVFAEVLILNKPLVSTDVADIKLFIPNKYIAEIENISSLKEKILFALKNYDNLQDEFKPSFKNAQETFTLNNMTKETIKLYEEVSNVKH